METASEEGKKIIEALKARNKKIRDAEEAFTSVLMQELGL